MKVGELSNTNMRAMTPRTKFKIDETLDILVKGIFTDPDPDEFGEGHTEEQKLLSIRIRLYNALRWTADDVLAQAIDDGYKPTAEGVL